MHHMAPKKIREIELSLLEDAFVLDITRWPDEPIPKTDRVLYTDSLTGRSLVARAPMYQEERAPA